MEGRVSPERLEELRKRLDDVTKTPIDLLEGAQDHGGIGVPERYENGDVAFHAHLRVSREGKDLEPCELCASYQALAIPHEFGSRDTARTWVQYRLLDWRPRRHGVRGAGRLVPCRSGRSEDGTPGSVVCTVEGSR